MALSRDSFLTVVKSILPDVGAAVRRFSLAALISAVFTGLHIVDADEVLGLDIDAWMRLSFGLGAAFLWSVSVCLYAERKSWVYGRRFITELLGFVVITGFYALPIAFSFQPQLFVLALAILVGLAPYFDLTTVQNASFWQFNHHLWLGAGLAIVSAVLFAGGLSVIIWTLELLFDLDFPNSIHKNIWTIGLGLIAPLNWLSLTPDDFSINVPEGEQEEFTSRAVAVIVKYILVPLLLVYTAILYAYAVQIALDGVLPKGRLGPMVLTYGSIGTLTILFAWPSRVAGGPFVAFFWRHWFWLTLGPVALLVLAAYKRIAQYGVTEERYLVMVAGIWLVVMAIWFMLRQKQRDIRLLPLSLCLLLMIASIGPWGAVGLSVQSQLSQLANLLEENGRLKSGKIVPVESGNKLPRDIGNRVSSIIFYLQRQDRLDLLADWFVALDDNPFQTQTNTATRTKAVAKILGAPKWRLTHARARRFNFNASSPVTTNLSGRAWLLGPIQLSIHNDEVTVEPHNQSGFSSSLNVKFSDGVVILSRSSGAKIRFNVLNSIKDLVPDLLHKKREKRTPERNVPLSIKFGPDEADAVLLIESFSGRKSEDHISLERLKIWLLLSHE